MTKETIQKGKGRPQIGGAIHINPSMRAPFLMAETPSTPKKLFIKTYGCQIGNRHAVANQWIEREVLQIHQRLMPIARQSHHRHDNFAKALTHL